MKAGIYRITAGLILFLLLVSGCTTLESTTRYYRMTTANPLPAKPEGTTVPILFKDKTRRSYKVIGEMEFASGGTTRFILDAVQYNARIHGADAVFMTRWEQDESHYIAWHPARIGYRHAWACDSGYYWSGNYMFPAYTVDTYVTTRVKAEMVTFLDRETFGFLGFLLEDVRNADFLDVGQVINGSPAALAGFRPGDRIRSIGDYACRNGLEHYHREGPIFTAGESVMVTL